MNPPIPTRHCVVCGKLTNDTQSVIGVACQGCFNPSPVTDRVRAALEELVALEDMYVAFRQIPGRDHTTAADVAAYKDYRRRLPLAWAEARTALAAEPAKPAAPVVPAQPAIKAWCCPIGEALGVEVCPECDAVSTAYSADMAPVRSSPGPVEMFDSDSEGGEPC